MQTQHEQESGSAAGTDKVTAIGDHRNQQTAKLVGNITNTALDTLEQLSDSMFERADDVLFDMSETATSDTERNLYFDAMRLLRIERKPIARGFMARIKHNLKEPQAADAGLNLDIDIDEMSLTPNEQVEERIAVGNIVDRAMRRHAESIRFIEFVLGQLGREPGIRIQAQALSPGRICDAISHALGNSELALEIKLIVYKLYERFMLTSLGGLYTQVSGMLREQGWSMPKSARVSQPRATRREPNQHGSAVDSDPSADAAIAQRHGRGRSPNPIKSSQGTVARLLDGLARLEAQGRLGESAGVGNSAANDDDVDAGQLFDAINAICEGPGAQLDNDALTRLLLDAFDSAPRRDGAVVKSSQRKSSSRRLTLRRAALLFTSVLENENLTAAGRKLVRSLREPVLKSALLDERFFQEADHPARNLVYEVAMLGGMVHSEDSPSYIEADELLRLLGDEFERDPGVIEQVYANIRELIELEYGRQDRNRKIRRIKQRAIKQIRAVTEDRRLPLRARPFIMRALGPMICMRDLRHGPDSSEYQAAVSDLRRILAALQAPPAGETGNRAGREPEIAPIMALARACLEEIRMPAERAQTLLAGLQAALQAVAANAAVDRQQLETFDLSQALDAAGTHQTQAAVQANVPRTPPPSVKIHATETQPTEVDQAAVEQPTELAASAPGPRQAPPAPMPDTAIIEFDEPVRRFMRQTCRAQVWMRVAVGENGSKRWLKIIRYDEDQARVVFGNRRGVEVLTKPALKLAQELQSGQSSAVFDGADSEARLSSLIGAQAQASSSEVGQRSL